MGTTETITELPGIDLPAEETGVECAKCLSDLLYTEDIFLVRVVTTTMENKALQYYDIIDTDGNARYSPGFFCYGCWDELLEELKELYEDVPPVKDAAGFMSCDICDCDIREGETIGLLQLGEIHLSARCPNGKLTPKFVPTGQDQHVCVGCLYHLDAQAESSLWPEDIEVLPDVFVCQEGIFDRCWRTGNCTCPAATTGDDNG